MTAFEAFKQSNAWDQEHQLPTSPTNNNPWFYSALGAKIIKNHDNVDPLAIKEFNQAVLNFMAGCEKEPGLFDRWPKPKFDSNPTSQDELIGIAYLNEDAALRILHVLFENDGIYMNKDAGNVLPESQDMDRFVWLDPYLRSCAGKSVSLLSQLKYSLYLVVDMFATKKGTDDASGRLLRFVMNEKMQNYWLSDLFVQLWKWRMKKIECYPKDMLKLEPKENPVFSEFAPEFF